MENLARWEALLPEVALRREEPLAAHTSFRIGGPAEVMAFPKNGAELAKILKTSALLDEKVYILGAGTNILAPDAGVRGMVVCLKDGLDALEALGGGRIRVGAGVTLARAAVYAANLNLGGLEFAHGIPGTVGGGVYMNAGAYGGEIGMVCQKVRVLGENLEISQYSGEEMAFSYRHSRLQEGAGIVLDAEFALTARPEAEIRETMRSLQQRRREKQPLDKPSAGSAFKRPAGGYAAALIEQAGLKGFQIGGAAVSEKHAGFVVNLGGATAEDVKRLLDAVAKRVYEASGVWLEPEIRIW